MSAFDVSELADRLIAGCDDRAAESGLRWSAELEPIGGPGATVKPAVYEGGRYQLDRRWESVDDPEPAPVVVVDNTASQANRVEAALQAHREQLGLPELVLDLSGIGSLPAHLPRTLSSWQFPHRVADAYLRDARLGDADFLRTELGRTLFSATPWAAAPLVAWFPQALVFGFWQSHLGKKRANTKLARAWVSEIIGWRPAAIDTKVMGLKGDALNLSTDEVVTSNADDRQEWALGKEKGSSTAKLSDMGHGQVPFMKDADAAPAGISFARLTQAATLSLAQLRRVSLGGEPDADAAARALVAGVALCGHTLAFTGGFTLRSGADLRARAAELTWLGARGDEAIPVLDADAAIGLVGELRDRAAGAGVALDGWGAEPVVLTPKDNLARAIRSTWPLDD